MIKRDIIEDSIREKLHDYKVEPAKDMWAAIESDLGKIAPQRRIIPLRTRIARYSVAATLLIAALTFGIVYNQNDEIKIAELIEPVSQTSRPTQQPKQTETASLIKETDKITSNPTKVLATLSTTHQNKKPMAANQLGDTSPTDIHQVKTTSQTPPAEQDKKSIEATKSVSSESPKTKSADTPTEQVKKPQKTQWYDEVEQPKKRRHNSRRSTSMYAANLGLGSSDVSIPHGNLQRMASEFRIHEMNSITGVATPLITEYNPESLRHHAPLSFGVSFSWSIGPRFDIETGLTYTYLKSDAETKGDMFLYKQKQELHYLGIPVSARYNIIGNKHFGLYARGGAMIERGIYGKFSTKIKQTDDAKAENTVGNSSSKIDIDGVQMSLSIGMGAEYKFTKRLGIYLEPNLNYYFANDSQPINYRTKNNLNFGLKAGLRVNIK